MIRLTSFSLVIAWSLSSSLAYDYYGASSAPAVTCPPLRCLNPCLEACDSEQCETSVGTSMYNGIQCETCPKFVKCHALHHRSGNTQQAAPQNTFNFGPDPQPEPLITNNSNNVGPPGLGSGIPTSRPLAAGETPPPPCPFITCPRDPCGTVQCDSQKSEVCNPQIERVFSDGNSECSDCSIGRCEILGDRIFGGGGPPLLPGPPACPIPSCVDPCRDCENNGGTCTLGPVSTFRDNNRDCPGCPTASCEFPPPVCPVTSCANPCASCYNTDDCETKPGTFPFEGLICPGCDVLVKCFDEPTTCPPPSSHCRDPCRGRGCYNDECETEPSFFQYHGLKCEECPVFKQCAEPPPPPPPSCCAGREPSFCAYYGCTCCSDGKYYRGECQYMGLDSSEPCYQPPPPPYQPPPPFQPAPQEKCGNTVCAAGLECCNPSCGICTPPNGFCSQQFCQSNNNNYYSGNSYYSGYNNKYGGYPRGGNENNNNLRRQRGGKGMMNKRK